MSGKKVLFLVLLGVALVLADPVPDDNDNGDVSESLNDNSNEELDNEESDDEDIDLYSNEKEDMQQKIRSYIFSLQKSSRVTTKRPVDKGFIRKPKVPKCKPGSYQTICHGILKKRCVKTKCPEKQNKSNVTLPFDEVDAANWISKNILNLPIEFKAKNKTTEA